MCGRYLEPVLFAEGTNVLKIFVLGRVRRLEPEHPFSGDAPHLVPGDDTCARQGVLGILDPVRVVAPLVELEHVNIDHAAAAGRDDVVIVGRVLSWLRHVTPPCEQLLEALCVLTGNSDVKVGVFAGLISSVSRDIVCW